MVYYNLFLSLKTLASIWDFWRGFHRFPPVESPDFFSSTFLFWNLIFYSISSQFIWVLLVSPSCESWFVLFWCVFMFFMTEVIDRHDFHGFDSGLKVIMGSHLWSIVQNIQVKTNQMETSVYIQIIFKSLSCLFKQKGFNSDIIQRLSNFDYICRCRMVFD